MKPKPQLVVRLFLLSILIVPVGTFVYGLFSAKASAARSKHISGQKPTPSPTVTQTPATSSSSTPTPFPTPENHQKNLDNGIVVSETKIYDEKSLKQLIATLEQNLADLRFINQGAIAGGLGRFQGERQDMSSFGLNLSTAPVPGVVTTANTGVTNTLNQVTTQPSVPAGSPTPSASVQTTTNSLSPNTIQQVTTQPQLTPAVPALPAQSSAFTTQQTTGLSGQDLLAEQVALQYQVMDLQMLLNQANSDKVLSFQSGTMNLSGRRAETVIGFQVSLNSPDEHKNEVAEVEIELTTKSAAVMKAPSLVFLLPRDKTYNVAAVTKDSKQIGLGAILGVFSVGVSGGKSKETLYLVAQTDTVALEKIHPADEQFNDKALTISWQFRPVLGQQTVVAGPRQVFALIALPALEKNRDYKASIRAYTRWRRYNMKAQSVGEVIDGSRSYRDFDDIGADSGAADVVLAPQVTGIDWSDTGSGQMLVTVHGKNFVSGTTVLAGNTVLSGPANGLSLQDENTMILLIPEQKFSQAGKVLIVGPQGAPVEVAVDRKFNFDPKPAGLGCTKPAGWGLRINSVKVEPYDSQNLSVTVELVNHDATPNQTEQPRLYLSKDPSDPCQLSDTQISPIAMVGNTFFGFKDVPLKRITTKVDKFEKFSFVVPAQVLRNAGKLVIKQPFLGPDYEDERTVSIPGDFTASQIVTTAADSNTAQVAISGNSFNRCLPIAVRLASKTFYRPMDTDLPCHTNNASAAVPGFIKTISGSVVPLVLHDTTMLTFTADQPDFKGVKQVIVEQAGAPAQMLALPSPPSIPEPVIDKQDSLLEGDVKTIQLTGSNFGSIEAASFEGVDLKPKASADGKTMSITVPSSMTQKPGDKDFNATLKNGVVKKYTLKVDKRP
jgi:hypothetical protein